VAAETRATSPWRLSIPRAKKLLGADPQTADVERARRRPLAIVLWAALPLALTTWAAFGLSHADLAGDFRYAFWPAAQHVLHGASPYVPPGSPAIAHAVAFVYPALAALLLAPLALIPTGVAAAVFASLQIGAVLATLRLLDVRDWRLYGLVLLCPAVFSGWTLANVTLLLGLGVALLWRYRDSPLAAGLLAAVLVSLKLFLWPLALWLAATRRSLALAYAATLGLALNVLAWSVLGWGELGRYLRLLNALADVERRRGYSVSALGLDIGVGRSASYALALVLAGCAAAGCFALGRRGFEVAALALALGASLLATPIVQLHYFALLIIPLALVSPRLGPAWALPLAMWVCASQSHPWQIALALALAAATVVVVVRLDLYGRVSTNSAESAQSLTSLPFSRAKTSAKLRWPANTNV
jgi:hypothetical protein